MPAGRKDSKGSSGGNLLCGFGIRMRKHLSAWVIRVKKGQTLGIIEAMKLMNEIESEYDGVVKEILIENGQMAEYGQLYLLSGND